MILSVGQRPHALGVHFLFGCVTGARRARNPNYLRLVMQRKGREGRACTSVSMHAASHYSMQSPNAQALFIRGIGTTLTNTSKEIRRPNTWANYVSPSVVPRPTHRRVLPRSAKNAAWETACTTNISVSVRHSTSIRDG
jgi:hypothetical protein